jgi:hypothetical protein
LPIKNWFGGGGKGRRVPDAGGDPDEPTLEDLIVLERYDEAASRLQRRLKDDPDDLHAHLRLAEVHVQLGQGGKALDEYAFVADEYARDGFFDKGLALLSKAAKLAPADEQLALKMEAFRQAKVLEHKRNAALAGLRRRPLEAGEFSAVELQSLWRHLIHSPIIDRMDSSQVERLFSHLGIRREDPHVTLVREGEAGDALLILVRGTLEAFTHPGEISVLTFGPGDVLGESVLFKQQGWPATYRTGPEGAILLTLDRQGLESCLTGNPNPRMLLGALRFQNKDAAVGAAVQKIRARR